MALCQQNHVIPCFFPPHSSNQLQALDLSLFRIIKQLITRTNRTEYENIQTKYIAEVAGSFLFTTTSLNIIQSFRLSGIYLVKNDEVLRCQVLLGQASGLLHPIHADIPGLHEIADDSDDADHVEA
jgi:hypothetical protein